ncbi:MAG TPA: PDZ domain-containing protein [Candidatus Acidoferrales bacterium]
MNLRRWMITLVLLALAAPAWGQGTRLLRMPTVSRDHVAFAYGGDLWVVSRNGGQARRLTSTPGVEADPHFSPDGARIAFTAAYAGNTDVYVVPTAGGQAKRLTYHPGLDVARGWTPDGRSVLFASERDTVPHAHFRLWTVAVESGVEEAVALPRAVTGSFAPGGRRLAYEELPLGFTPGWAYNQTSQWRHYRGGRTHPIRVISMADYSVLKLPWNNSNDTHPMWVGNTIYFLSDRNHTANLFAYDTSSRAVTQLTRHTDFDIMNASAGADAIVYEQGGYIHLFDLKTRQSRRMNIEVTGDFPWARPQFKRVAGMIRSATLSPAGVRAAFEARGEIFTVPANKGDWRNLTQSSGAHDRSSVWSPDGTQIAWLSDASGEYQLMISDQTGTAPPRSVALPAKGFYTGPEWSPNGEHILLYDHLRNLWMLEISSGKAKMVDSEPYHDPARQPEAVWAPDSQWFAYSRGLDNHMRAIFVYSLADGTSRQITDGLSDVVSPAFDAGGKFLYFLASTNYGPRGGWLEMSSLDRPVRRAVYLVVLNATDPSPLLPEPGDETKPVPPQRGGGEAKVTVNITFDGIGHRILAVNVPPGDYASLQAGPAGSFFYLEPMRATAVGDAGGPAGLRLHRYQLKERAAATFLEGVRFYTISGDRKKLLYSGAGNRWGIIGTERPPRPGEGAINVNGLQMWVDPREEWAQIFRETWRIQRDYFYDEKMHGADWNAVYERYRPMAEHIAHRGDLGYLMATVGGELGVGHSYLTGAGDMGGEDPVPVGLLGADLAIEQGRYRIKKIYTGENWNPELRAPLSAPGIQVSEGDYLLEVNGRQLSPPDLYNMFQGTVGRQTLIRINSSPSMEGSRVITVVPVGSEQGLRTRAWVENNRRRVDELSGGRLAYVWLPNTGTGGYSYFNRYYYAQQHKDGAVIDERFNQGGMVADYIVNELDRKLLGYFATRAGKKTITSPLAGIYGPKVMIINESAGSGGDALPFYFKLRKIGPLVGTRTWGALVGTLGVPPTIDGGGITAPCLAFYNLEGQWDVENVGVAPDIEVEYSPAEVIKGRDPQLERAVAEAMKLLEKNPPPRRGRPAPIDRVSGKN